MPKRFLVRVPGTSANIGSGFDSLGLSLNLYLTIRAKESLETEIRLSPPLKDRLPTDETNLVYRAFSSIFARLGRKTPPLYMELDSQIPLSRGLGSSASAIVAGMMLGNRWAEDPFTKEELLQFSYEMEGHPDNVAAALYGGMTVAYVEAGSASAMRVPVAAPLLFLAIVPETPLPTIQARSALPKVYERCEVIDALARLSLLITSVTSGDYRHLSEALADRIHQPYRLPLIPHGEEIISLSGRRNKGIYLSGAGPTFMAVFSDPREREAFQAMLSVEGVAWRRKVRLIPLEIDQTGAIVEQSSLTEQI